MLKKIQNKCAKEKLKKHKFINCVIFPHQISRSNASLLQIEEIQHACNTRRADVRACCMCVVCVLCVYIVRVRV